MHVIVLDGIGGMGSSSTAMAMQGLAAEPLLHVATHDVIAMPSPRYSGDPDGLVLTSTDAAEDPPHAPLLSAPDIG